MIHVDVCPDCGDEMYPHMLDPPNFCPHPKDRYVPDVYVPVREVVEWLEEDDHWQLASAFEREFKSPEVDIR
jgi:hypothetical protein